MQESRSENILDKLPSHLTSDILYDVRNNLPTGSVSQIIIMAIRSIFIALLAVVGCSRDDQPTKKVPINTQANNHVANQQGQKTTALCDTPSKGKLVSYPTAGVTFREPDGWHQQVRDKGKTIARWISLDSETGIPAAMIMVECGHPQDSSLDEVALGMARNFNGVIDDNPTSLDGTDAVRIIAKNDSRSLRPVEALAAIHDGRLYLIMGGVTAGHSVKKELESIRASWTWMPIEPPYQHLEFRDDPLPLAKDVATINVPALMHIYPNQEPDRVLDLGLHNFVRNAPDFLVYAQVLPMAQGQSFDEQKSRLSDGLQAEGLIKKPLEWKMLNNVPTCVVSEMIEAKWPDKGGGAKRDVLIRWALVKLDDGRLISANFTLPTDAPGDRNAYNNLVDRVVETIRPVAGAIRTRSPENNSVDADR